MSKCEICGSEYADYYYKNKDTGEIICEECLLESDGVTYDDEINQLRIDRNVTFDSLIYRNSIKKDALQELLEDKSK